MRGCKQAKQKEIKKIPFVQKTVICLTAQKAPDQRHYFAGMYQETYPAIDVGKMTGNQNEVGSVLL